MAATFTSFVMFAEMRTGSNFLEANLNALTGVACLGELFNPHFIGKKNCQQLFDMDLAARDAAPEDFLTRMRQQTPGLPGFRYFHDHEPRILDRLLHDRSCAKIILTRNPLDSYVSWKIAQATGQWKLTNAKNLKSAKAQFDATEFAAHVEKLQAFQRRLLHGLQTSGQTAFYLDYDDIRDLDVLNGLAGFLGVPARLKALDETLVRQNPESLEEKVENYAEIAPGLARLDRFDLGRTPNFEPRRSPNIPSYIAARDLGLLYMPLRGGPVNAVSHWLAQLGHGLTQDFNRRSLKDWLRQHGQHRSFTVLRHPLLRAHAAFEALILSGAAREHRQFLIRQFKAELPPPGTAFEDKYAAQAAFLSFLRYVKQALSGQNSQKVDPHWASQSAVLQGFSEYQSPDLLLRETGLPQGLTYLCAELGCKAPAYAPDPAAAKALAAIWSPDLETAAEETYGRDYAAFGFGRWQDQA